MYVMLCDVMCFYVMLWPGLVCLYVCMYLCMYVCIYDPAFHPGTYSETLCGTTKNEVVPQLDCKF